MSLSDGLQERRPSHARPYQARTDSMTSSRSGVSPGSRNARRIHSINSLDDLADRAGKRHTSTRPLPLSNPVRTLSQSLSSGSSHLADLGPGQNAAIYNNGNEDDIPDQKSTISISASCPLDYFEEERLPPPRDRKGKGKNVERSQDFPQGTGAQPAAAATKVADDGRIDVQQTMWQTISAVEENMKRLVAADGMQKILSYAVSMYYCGMGDKVLADLHEVHENAHQMQLRIINGQAQLWRAIILDDMNQTDLIPELLSDALVLLTPGSTKDLPVTDVPPEDADFFQLWRLLWVRKYWYSLWKYLKAHELRDDSNIPVQDLESPESQAEGQEWIVRVVEQLGKCFNRTEWPDSDANNRAARFSHRLGTSFKYVHAGNKAGHNGSSRMTQEFQLMAQRLHELEIKDRSNKAKIERLQSDNLRYKAEREVFDTNLSTGFTHDGMYPQQAAKNWSNLFSNPAADIRDPEPVERLEYDPIHEQKLAEPRPSAALGPDKIELLAQQLRNVGNMQPMQQNQGHQASPKSYLGVFHPGNLTNYGQKSLPHRPDKSSNDYRFSKQSGRVNQWAKEAHGGRIRSDRSSLMYSPFSPNQISPISPASGRSWRRQRSSFDAVSRSSSKSRKAMSEFRGNRRPVQKTKRTPIEAWNENKAALLPSSRSTSSASGPDKSSPSADQFRLLDHGEASDMYGNLEEELGDDVTPNSHPFTPFYNSTIIGKRPSRIKEISTIDNYQESQISPSISSHSLLDLNSNDPNILESDTPKSLPASPKSVSPVTSLEDLPLTDTPGGEQLEEALSHIRAHQEQRRRSMSSTSSDGEDLIKYQDKHQPFSRTADQGHIAEIDRSLPSENLAQESSVDNGQMHSNMNVGLSPSVEQENEQIQFSRKIDTSRESALKLEMPILPSTVSHRRKGSAVPASPSPLRASFSQSVASEDPGDSLENSESI